jgi:hypothetical protein
VKAERREWGAGRKSFWFENRSSAEVIKRKAWGAKQFMKPKQRNDAWANDLRSGACEKNKPERSEGITAQEPERSEGMEMGELRTK